MIKNAKLGKEIVVTVANKVGVLAEMAKIVAEHGINIEAVTGYGMEQEARIHLVTSDNLRASEALKKTGYTSQSESAVVVVELENKLGALKLVTEKIAKEGIDIRYMYGTTCTMGCPATAVFSTSDNDKALVALKKT